MKIIITIPDEKYHYIKELERGNTDYATTLMLYHAVKYGEPFTRPQGEWIPISERLPEGRPCRDWYLGIFREPDTGFIGVPYICDYVGNITKGTTKEGWILRGFTDTDDANEYYKSLECVAWQPLPEPYKAEMRGKAG